MAHNNMYNLYSSTCTTCASGYATGKRYSTVRQCFLNRELKSDVLATVFTTLLSESELSRHAA